MARRSQEFLHGHRAPAVEKDVRLPIRYIRSALPDGCDGYSIDSVYGLCGSAWESDAVKEIHVPRNICQMEEAMAG